MHDTVNERDNTSRQVRYSPGPPPPTGLSWTMDFFSTQRVFFRPTPVDDLKEAEVSALSLDPRTLTARKPLPRAPPNRGRRSR